jgi:hypothetical protein
MLFVQSLLLNKIFTKNQIEEGGIQKQDFAGCNDADQKVVRIPCWRESVYC